MQPGVDFKLSVISGEIPNLTWLMPVIKGVMKRIIENTLVWPRAIKVRYPSSYSAAYTCIAVCESNKICSP